MYVVILQGQKIVAEGELNFLADIEVATETEMVSMTDPEVILGVEMQFNASGGPYRMHFKHRLEHSPDVS